MFVPPVGTIPLPRIPNRLEPTLQISIVSQFQISSSTNRLDPSQRSHNAASSLILDLTTMISSIAKFLVLTIVAVATLSSAAAAVEVQSSSDAVASAVAKAARRSLRVASIVDGSAAMTRRLETGSSVPETKAPKATKGPSSSSKGPSSSKSPKSSKGPGSSKGPKSSKGPGSSKSPSGKGGSTKAPREGSRYLKTMGGGGSKTKAPEETKAPKPTKAPTAPTARTMKPVSTTMTTKAPTEDGTKPPMKKTMK
jgi:hypothetical protein